MALSTLSIGPLVNSKSTKWHRKIEENYVVHVFYCCDSPTKMASESYLHKIGTVDTYLWEKAKIRNVVDTEIIIMLIVIVRVSLPVYLHRNT